MDNTLAFFKGPKPAGDSVLIGEQGGSGKITEWVNTHHAESTKFMDGKIQGLEASLAKGVAEAKTTIRLLDEVVNSNFLNIINKHKNKLPQWAIGKGNFECAEVTIEGITKNEYFAHSAIQAEIESIKGTGILIKPDSTLLKAIKVDGNNVVDGAGAWLRDVDTEFKILSEIQNKLGTEYSTAGKIKLFTELECCPSCLDIIEQFKNYITT
ncbi:deaminase domain-containing protein [Bacillus sp. FJAT-51639]|uniref:Deaminase domain-containing protein n=1 Tax=Bacillus bruguierae TaxID=3127667 RepID=A0ABU8FL56_9BACI